MQNGTFKILAIVLANSVLPVPVSPIKSILDLSIIISSFLELKMRL